METYKKPIVAGKSMSSIYRRIGPDPRPPVGWILKKIFGVDDFHKEESLTPRKKAID